MGHTWVKSILAEAREHVDANGKVHIIDEVGWFTKCEHCGCLVAPQGKRHAYRATPAAQWSADEPECAV